MTRVVVTAPADWDTAEILTTLVREAGLATAERYIGRFHLLYDRLARHPRSCQAQPQLGAAVRACVVRPYLVFYEYQPRDDQVSIIRILHGSRRITPGLLLER